MKTAYNHDFRKFPTFKSSIMQQSLNFTETIPYVALQVINFINCIKLIFFMSYKFRETLFIGSNKNLVIIFRIDINLTITIIELQRRKFDQSEDQAKLE